MATGAILPRPRVRDAAGIVEDISRGSAASTAKMAVATEERMAMVPVTLVLGPPAIREAHTTTKMSAVPPCTELASEAMIGPSPATLATIRLGAHALVRQAGAAQALHAKIGPTVGLHALLPRTVVEEAPQAGAASTDVV